MKKNITASLIILAALALFFTYHRFFSNKSLINRLITDGIESVVNENIEEIVKLISLECEDRIRLLYGAQELFESREFVQIKVVRKQMEIDKRSATVEMLIILTVNIKGQGKVKEKELVRLELKKEDVKSYRGWRVTKIAFN